MHKSSLKTSIVLAVFTIMVSLIAAVALDKVEKIGNIIVNPLKTAQKLFVFTEGCWENFIV